MGLQAAFSLLIPKKVYSLLLPLREELKIPYYGMRTAQQIARKSNMRTSMASWSPASMAVTGDPLKQNCAAEAAARCCCRKHPPAGAT